MAGLEGLTTAELMALRNQVVAQHAIHQNESSGAPDTATGIVNPASGARGSMQVLPSTAASPGFGVSPSNNTPTDDARTGRDYMTALTQRYGDPETAAIAYNWGPGNTDKWIADGRNLSQLPLETLKYLRNFKQNVASTNGGAPATSAPVSPVAAAPTLEQQVASNPPGGTPTAPGAPDTGGSILPAMKDVLPEFGRQLGLTARDMGHGLAAGAGALTQGFTRLMGVPDVQDVINQFVDSHTPQPQGALEQNVNNIASTVANPLNYIVPAGEGIAQNALAGGAVGGMQPNDGSIGQAAANVVGGAVGGGALGAVGKALGGATLSPEAQSLIDQGVKLTPGQAVGGTLNSVEQKATSFPFVGEQIAKARANSVKEMNTVLYNQVLSPIGEKAPVGVTGRDAVEQVGQKISAEYEKVLPQVTFKVDSQLKQDMAPILQQVSTMPPDIQNAYHGIMNRTIGSQAPQGVMSGTAFKDADSVIGREAANFSGSSDAFQRNLGQVLQQTQGALRNSLERTNPDAPALGPINQAWKNFTVLRNAGARVNTPDTPIMPGQLQAAVKAGDKSVGKGAFAKGNANMQDLSDASMKVLGANVPDSGTAGRGMLGGFLAGGGIAKMIAHPAATTAALGTGALYGTNLGRQAMLKTIVARPDWLRAFGNNTSLLAPSLGAGAALTIRKDAEGDR